MKHDFHNPDNLTAEQIGYGYRLLLKSEREKSETRNVPKQPSTIFGRF